MSKQVKEFMLEGCNLLLEAKKASYKDGKINKNLLYQYIKEQANISYFHEEFGLCSFLKIYVIKKSLVSTRCVYNIIKGYAKNWEKFSGNPEYPVPSKNDYSAADKYFYSNNKDKWLEGEYAENRWEFVVYVKQCLENDIDNGG